MSSPAPEYEPLGIIAGGGDLPRLLAEKCRGLARPYFVIALRGVENGWVDAHPHARLSPGQIGHIFAALRDAGASLVTIAGEYTRPDLLTLRLDAFGLRFLPRIRKLLRQGDDALLSELIAFIEEHGFEVIAPQALLGEGASSTALFSPVPDHLRDDIARGADILRHLSPADVGQGVVVQSGVCLAVEAIEGTRAMLARVAALPKGLRPERGGVFCKAPKTRQERRADMPTIGPDTLKQMQAADLEALAISSEVLIISEDEVRELAIQTGILIVPLEL